MMSRTSRMVKVSTTMPELFANHIGSVPSSENIMSGGPEMDGLDLESLTRYEFIFFWMQVIFVYIHHFGPLLNIEKFILFPRFV